MRRLRFFSASLLLATTAAFLACASTEEAEAVDGTAGDGGTWDAAAVAPLDGSTADGAGSGPETASCEAYCKDVLGTCTGEDTQYAAPEECSWVCARLTPGDLGDKDVSTLACRAYHASTTAKTDPHTWCGAAGAFGGGVCGDRCAAFCQLTLAVCTAPSGPGKAPWADVPACVTACAEFAYLDGGVDGGGDGTAGTPSGDTFNCRQRALRAALRDPSRCADLAETSASCR